MRGIRRTVVWSAMMLVAGLAMFGLHAQVRPELVTARAKTATAEEIVNAARVEAALDPIPEKTVPLFTFDPLAPAGTYWMLQTDTPPWPFDPFPELMIFPLGGNTWLVDDRSVDYPALNAAIAAQVQARKLGLSTTSSGSQMMTLDSGPPPPPGGGGGDGGTNEPPSYDPPPPYNYPSNALWLEITGVSNNVAHLTIHGTERDVVYEILSKVELTNGAWAAEGTVLGVPETNCTPATVALGSHTNTLFFWARSWVDSDGSGLPDWWQLEHFGLVGVDPYADPDGDGWVNLQEYQNGQNPHQFETPAAPTGLKVALTNGGAHANLSWHPSRGAVTSYTIQRSLDSTTVTVSASVTSFSDTQTTLPTGLYWQVPKYRIQANYAGGDSAWGPWMNAPESVRPSVAVQAGASAEVWVVAGAVPSTAAALRIGQDSTDNPPISLTNVDLSVSAFSNGLARLPEPFASLTTNGHWYAQWVSTNQALSAYTILGYPPTIPFWDGRPHLKQNLAFLLRAATPTAGFGYWYDDGIWAPYWMGRPTNYAFASFREEGYYAPGQSYVSLQELQPFEENYRYRNFVFNGAELGQDGHLATGLFWESGRLYLGYPPRHVFAPPANPATIPTLLSAAETRWLYWTPSTPWVYWPQGAWSEMGVTWTMLNGDTPAWQMSSHNRNLFGLPYLSAQLVWGSNATERATVAVNGTLLDLDGWFYAETAQPVFQTAGYYFAQARWDNQDWIPDHALPGLPAFSPSNPLPVLIAALGHRYEVAGFAKLAITNGYPNTFGYLEQYFDKALKIAANGGLTTNETGILSPYGEFFPTEPGPTAQVTMPDLDTGERGTGIVHVLKLQLDVNHDGEMDLSFGGQDNTSQACPARMWVNNDHDEPARGSDPDRDLNDWGNPPPVPLDYSYGQIRCQRNLEDFARLWICGIPTLPTSQAYSVQLSWSQISSGAPRMRLYWASETNGGIGYLTNATIAAQQIAQHNTPIGEISPTSTLTLPANVFSNGVNKCFLYEAGGVGSGQLRLTISQGGTNTIAQTSAWFDFHDIMDFCEWGLVTNVLQDWPDMVQTNLTSGFQVLSYAKVNPGDAKQIAVFIHGWRMGVWDWFSFSSTMFKRLWWQGYQGRFAALRWPSRNANTELFPQMGYITYNRSEHIAFKSGTGAAAYVNDLRNRFPDYTISGCSHSMGGIVAMQTLKQLAAAGQRPVDNWVLMQAAVPAHCFDTNAPSYQLFLNGEVVAPTPDTYRGYAAGITNALRPGGRISNFFNTNDFALSTWEINQSFYNANLFGYGVTTMKPNSFLGYSSDGTNGLLSTNAWNLSFWSTIYGGYYPHGPTRTVTDALELMPFVSRPRSLAVGAQPGVHGQVLSELNLSALGFSNSPGDHSGQVNRNVQEAPVWPLYAQLKTNLFLQP